MEGIIREITVKLMMCKHKGRKEVDRKNSGL